LSDYKIEFTPKCLENLEEIEQIPHIDEALQAVYSGLRENPYAFDIIPPLARLRCAKTKFYLRDNFSVPPLIITFTIIEDDKLVRIIEVRKRRGFGDLDIDDG
jgi:hypothetical protein